MAEAPGAKMLKVVGIIMVVFGGLGAVFIPATTMILPFIAAIYAQMGIPFSIDAFRVGLIVGFVASLYNVFAGIMAILYNASLYKARILRLIGIIAIAIVVIGVVIDYILLNSMQLGGMSAVSGLPINLVLPVLYVVGAVKNMGTAK